ncbi:MAG: sigma-70 family RNA polymerase sigma factor [Armatimonadota bacterium]|nr:sigma-70 family RNA polymerase sigma factor [Armatimonadota bacterium]
MVVTPEGDAAQRANDAQRRFEDLVGRRLGLLRSAAMRLVRNPTDADDLVQETLLRAWRSFHTFRHARNPTGWLVRILRNAYIDRLRTYRRAPAVVPLDDVLDEPARLPAWPASSDAGDPTRRVEAVLDPRLADALRALPAPFRRVVVLADVHALRYREIAATMGIPMGTVMSRLLRGRRRLRRHLEGLQAAP